MKTSNKPNINATGLSSKAYRDKVPDRVLSQKKYW